MSDRQCGAQQRKRRAARREARHPDRPLRQAARRHPPAARSSKSGAPPSPPCGLERDEHAREWRAPGIDRGCPADRAAARTSASPRWPYRPQRVAEIKGFGRFVAKDQAVGRAIEEWGKIRGKNSRPRGSPQPMRPRRVHRAGTGGGKERQPSKERAQVTLPRSLCFRMLFGSRNPLTDEARLTPRLQWLARRLAGGAVVWPPSSQQRVETTRIPHPRRACKALTSAGVCA